MSIIDKMPLSLRKAIAGIGLGAAAVAGAEQVGENVGKKEGTAVGVDIGLEAGKKIGLAQGEQIGKKAGFEQGKSVGRQEKEDEIKAAEIATTEKAKNAKSELDKEKETEKLSLEFQRNQEKLKDELDVLNIDKREQKGFAASEGAVEVSAKVFELKAKEVLNDYSHWLRSDNSGEAKKSADVLVAMIQTETGLKAVKDMVSTNDSFKKDCLKLVVKLSNLRDSIAKTGNNLEDESQLFREDEKDSYSIVDYHDSDNMNDPFITVETGAKDESGQPITKEKRISMNEANRRFKLYEDDKKYLAEQIQDRLNSLAMVLTEKPVAQPTLQNK